MKVPCLLWLQGPWSPAGYDVVELKDEAAPATYPLHRKEAPAPPRSPLGYRVVEVGSSTNPEPPSSTSPNPLPEPPRAEKKAQPRPPRRRVGWVPFAVGGSFIAAITLVLLLIHGLGQARSVPPRDADPFGMVAAAPADACQAAPQEAGAETFGTAVRFQRNVAEAGQLAGSQHKLLFLLHVSGNFEDTGFT